MFNRNKQAAQARQPRTPAPAERGRLYLYHSSRSQRTDDDSAAARSLQPEITLDQRARAVSDRPRRLTTVILTSLMVVLAGWGFYLDGNASVVMLGSESAGKVFLRDPSVYEEAADATLSGLWFRNKITADTERAAAALQGRFPELQAVTVSLPVIGTSPTVYVYPSQPKLIFVAEGAVYLLDRSGRALATGNQVASLEDLHIPVVSDQSGLPVELGSVVLPEPTVTFICEIVGQLNAKGITTSSLILPPGSTELHIKMDGAEYYVKYNLHGNAREAVGTYLAVRRYLETTGKKPGEYVDVRVSNKAYYR